MVWSERVIPEKELRILLAAWVCLQAFGVSTRDDQGGFGDECRIDTLLESMFPDQGRNVIDQYRNNIDSELERLFARPHIRAAVQALVEILTAEGEIEGPQAEAVLDRHLGTESAANA